MNLRSVEVVCIVCGRILKGRPGPGYGSYTVRPHGRGPNSECPGSGRHDHRPFLLVGTIQDCAEQITAALRAEAKHRHEAQGLDWIEHELVAVMDAANVWALTHEGCHMVTLDDVRRADTQASGHVDYGSKFGWYVAELVYRRGAAWIKP